MTDLKIPLLGDLRTLEPTGVWVLLWSQRQRMLHIETLAEMLVNHLRAFQNDLAMEYVPLAIGDEAHVERAAEAIRPTLEARYEAARGGDHRTLPYASLP